MGSPGRAGTRMATGLPLEQDRACTAPQLFQPHPPSWPWGCLRHTAFSWGKQCPWRAPAWREPCAPPCPLRAHAQCPAWLRSPEAGGSHRPHFWTALPEGSSSPSLPPPLRASVPGEDAASRRESGWGCGSRGGRRGAGAGKRGRGGRRLRTGSSARCPGGRSHRHSGGPAPWEDLRRTVTPVTRAGCSFPVQDRVFCFPLQSSDFRNNGPLQCAGRV